MTIPNIITTGNQGSAHISNPIQIFTESTLYFLGPADSTLAGPSRLFKGDSLQATFHYAER